MLGSDDTTKMPTVEGPTPGATPPPDAPPPLGATPPPPLPPGAPPPPLPPAWRPPQTDDRRIAPLIFGVIVLVVGLWFFATRTLGLDLPRLEWDQLWPLILIVLGVWIVARSFRRAR